MPVDNAEGPDRRALIMTAVAIVEWNGALEHLDALERAGHPVRTQIRGRIQQEANYYQSLWPTLAIEEPDGERRVVNEARAYLTKHRAELDELLNGTENE